MIVSIIFCNKMIDFSNVSEILLLIVEGSEALILLFVSTDEPLLLLLLIVEGSEALLLLFVSADDDTMLMVNVLMGENIFRDTI